MDEVTPRPEGARPVYRPTKELPPGELMKFVPGGRTYVIGLNGELIRAERKVKGKSARRQDKRDRRKI